MIELFLVITVIAASTSLIAVIITSVKRMSEIIKHCNRIYELCRGLLVINKDIIDYVMIIKNKLEDVEFNKTKMNAVRYLSSDEFKEVAEKETLDKLPILLEINKLGFITIDSQISKKEKFKHILTGETCIMTQVGYVIGLMQRKHVEEFIVRINTETNMTMIVINSNHDERSSLNPKYGIPVTYWRTLKDEDFKINANVQTRIHTDITHDTFEQYKQKTKCMSDVICIVIIDNKNN